MEMNTLKNIGAIAAIGICSVVSVSAQAADKAAAGTGPSPFVDCGIGGALFPNTSWAAISSNVIWDVGTTALTSARMSPETCNGKKANVVKFIYSTHDILMEETAQGQGEHLSAMLNMYGCDAAAHEDIIGGLRQSVSKDLRTSDYSSLNQIQKTNALYDNVTEVVQT